MLHLLLLLLLLSFSFLLLYSYQQTNIDYNHEISISDKVVSLAVQGSKNELSIWIDIYKIMINHYNHTKLFLFAYDAPLDSPLCASEIICIHDNSKSWTSGRNYLARTIYQYEVQHNDISRYWLFSDADMSLLTCEAVSESLSINEQAAFCLGRFIQVYLLSSISFAQVFFMGQLSRETEFYHFDCGDAQFHAIHRIAVPLILPYVELLDNLSWWESQQFVWRVSAGCLPNSGVGSGMLSSRNIEAKHGEYPRGTFHKDRQAAINKIYGSRDLSPHPIDNSLFNTVAGDCSNQENSILERKNRTDSTIPDFSNTRKLNKNNTILTRNLNKNLNRSLKRNLNGKLESNSILFNPEDIERSSLWRHTKEFHYCHKNLKSRFETYMETGDLISIDGELYPAIVDP
jgi:hypothetical protein